MALVAPIAASSSGDNTVVAAVTGKKIRVKAYAMTNGAASVQNVKWRSGTTDITGLFYSTAIGPIVVHDMAPGNEFYFETAAGAALNLNLSAATAVGGSVQYTLE
jgi:uncharacterized surface anchored protein